MGFRKQGSITAAALLTLVLPSAASAHDYCVNRDGCAPARTFDATGLQAALDAAGGHANSGDPDRVLVGPGQYVAPGSDGFVYFSADPVEVVGAGSGAGGTRLVPAVANGSNRRIAVLTGGTHRIGKVSIEVPGGDGHIGLGIEGSAFDLKIDAAATATRTAGIFALGSATVTHAAIDLPSSPPASPLSINAGITGASPASLTVRDSSIKAHLGISGGGDNLVVQRVRTDGISGVDSVAVNARVESSLLRVTHSGRGVRALAHGRNASLAVDNVTIIGSGAGEPAGVTADSDSSGHSSFASVTNTVIRGVDHPLEAHTNTAGAGAEVFAEYSDLEPAGNRADGGGTHSVGLGAGNRTAGDDPRFVSTTGPDAYRLRHDSPLVDRGADWAPVAGESAFDLASNARIVNAKRDIGAFEYGRNAPRIVDNSFPSSGSTGEPFTFDAASSSDPDPGETLTYSWSWDDGSPASPGARVTHAFATPGEHTATVTVTDPAGVTSTATRTVTVRQAPPVSPPAGGDPATPPGTPPGQPGLSGLGFSFGAAKAKKGSSDIVVTLRNTSARAYQVSVGTSEREPSGKRRRTVRFTPVTRTLQPGVTTTLVLKAPRKLATQLKRQGARKGTVVRKPRITVKNLATGKSATYSPRVVSRWRKGGTR